MTIDDYNGLQTHPNVEICDKLRDAIMAEFTTASSKVWHGHPVWFLEGNPVVGYSVQKAGVRLMFWSGRSFDEPLLTGNSRFKDASIFYNNVEELDERDVARWLEKAKDIQWDYKNIVKRKGKLEKLGEWKC